jgi:hypothetical protein
MNFCDRIGVRLCPRFRPEFVLALVVCLSAQHAAADVITQWNFNGNGPGINNSPVPSTGTGTAGIVGMNGGPNGDSPAATNGIGSSDPSVTPNDLSWRARGITNNGWSGATPLLSGAQFLVSTVGFTGITLSFDINATDGSPRHAQLQYTTDGTNFTSFGPLFDFNATNDNWANGLSRDLSSIPGANNNPNFGFKIVSAFSPDAFTDLGGLHAANTAFQRADADPLEGPYNGTAGNYRFDMVTISGIAVPEPSALALAGLAALSGCLVMRRKRFLPR